MTMPNFLIVGAAKSATSSLYAYLRQHPQIFMSPIKEPRFFAFEDEVLDFCGPGDDEKINRTTITDLDDYRALFKDISHEKAIGEVSPAYLYISKAPERIRHYRPDVKLIAVLRNPVDRAFSNFMQKRREGDEPLADFTEAIKEEPTRICKNWSFAWHSVERGKYYKQLLKYFDLFPRKNIKVYLYDNFKTSNLEVLQDIFRHLDVDDNFCPNFSTQHNFYARPKSKILSRFLREQSATKEALKLCLPKSFQGSIKRKIMAMNSTRPTLTHNMRQPMMKYFQDDIGKLENLLDRDLSSWDQS